MLDRLEIPADRERIVLNCNTPPFPGSFHAEVADRIGRDVDFEVPYDKRVLRADPAARVLDAGRRGWGRVVGDLIDDAASIAGLESEAPEQELVDPSASEPSGDRSSVAETVGPSKKGWGIKRGLAAIRSERT